MNRIYSNFSKVSYQHMSSHEIDRLDKYLASKGINDNRFTELTGISNGWIGKARESKSSITNKTRLKILKAFPDLNETYLTVGIGSMEKNAQSLIDGPSKVEKEYKQKYHNLLEKHFETIEEMQALEKEVEILKQELRQRLR